jgi:hypothetical protein
MSAKALRTLATNGAPVIDLMLRQIAASYDPSVGMVKAAAPAGYTHTRRFQALHHLAFCMAAVEHGIALGSPLDKPLLACDPLVTKVVLKSILLWKKRYMSRETGLVAGIPGTMSTEINAWREQEKAMAIRARERQKSSSNDRPHKKGRREKTKGDDKRKQVDESNAADPVKGAEEADSLEKTDATHRNNVETRPQSICNAQWIQICNAVGLSSGVASYETFEKAFRGPEGGYTLYSDEECPDDVLATSYVMSVYGGDLASSEYLARCIASNDLPKKVSPYHAYFICMALAKNNPSTAIQFIEKFYGPLAYCNGTIREKYDDVSCTSYGGSIGFVDILLYPYISTDDQGEF